MMDSPDVMSEQLEAVSRHVRKLERDRKSLIVVLSVLAIYVLARETVIANSSGFISAVKVDTNEVRIQGRHSFPDIVLGSDASGLPSIRFYDSEMKKRLAIGLTSQNGASMSFFDPNGRERAALLTAQEGKNTISNLQFSGSNGKPYLVMGLKADNTAGIWFLNESGQPELSLTRTTDGKAELKMGNAGQEIGIRVDPVTGPAIELVKTDRQGKRERTVVKGVPAQ